MPWAKLDDRFPDHEKVASLSNSAFRLHVTALCYAADQLTDGFLALGIAKRIGWASDNLQQDIQDLLAARLWEATEGGYAIHDYLDYNPSGAQVKAERALAAARMREARDKQAKNADGTFGRSSGEVRANAGECLGEVTPSPSPSPSPSPVVVPDKRAVPKESGKGKPFAATPPSTPAIKAAVEPETQPAPKVLTPQQEMFGALTGICQLDAKLKASLIGKTAKRLLAAGYTPENLHTFATWWGADQWRAEHMPVPTLFQVEEKLKQSLTAPRKNGTGREHPLPPALAAIEIFMQEDVPDGE